MQKCNEFNFYTIFSIVYLIIKIIIDINNLYMTTDIKWENPVANITNENYEKGLIKSYELAFQDEEWYNRNKNNFCNSLVQDFPELVPSYALNYPKGNYLGFYPDEYIRFGHLVKINVNISSIDNNNYSFWAVKIPAGLRVYHISRSLGLNHSDFPIRGYNNTSTLNENLNNILRECPYEEFSGHEASDVINGKICTYISYYTTPHVGKEYLTKVKSTDFGGNQNKYAYGTSSLLDTKNYNDRLDVQANEQLVGVQAYKLIKDTYFIILGLDNFLIERPDLGRENMKMFKNIMINLESQIRTEMNLTVDGMQNFLRLIDSVTGIGTLADNVSMITRDYVNPNFERGLLDWLVLSTQLYRQNKITNTAGTIKDVSNKVTEDITDLTQYEGFRYSTYEHDRPVLNMLGWLFSGKYTVTFNGEVITVYGFTSSSMYVYTKGASGLKDEPYTRDNLQYYKPKGVFHSEMGLFYAPIVLERDRNNKFDLEYSINYKGITQELRKYKTSNIMSANSGFHQGHLLEHSMWVSLVTISLLDHEVFKDLIVSSKDVYLLAGYFHDIGKSGDCDKVAVYNGLRPEEPRMSVCQYVTDNNNIVGMRYYDIPDHPEKGYEFLKGYKTYKKYTLKGTNDIISYENNTIPIHLNDWEEMFEHLKISEYDRKLIRIAVATHWYMGNNIKNISDGTSTLEEAVIDFMSEVEPFYNNEFYHLDQKIFKIVLVFVILISVADIVGSEYNPSLPSSSLNHDERATLINYFPNVPLDLVGQPIISQIITYALSIKDNNSFKKNIINNLDQHVPSFIQTVINTNYKFTPSNNYSILYNLINSYENIGDIKWAYPSKFPKIIVFDLDQTLFAVTFNNNELSTYYIYPETHFIIEEVQKLRATGTIVALVSRHYSPKSLLNLLYQDSVLYYKNFDYIISQYTGSIEKLAADMKNISGFFEINGYPTDGFIIYENKITTNPIIDNMNQVSKYGHFKKLKETFNVEFRDILAFDDDSRYFTKEGLGDAKDVYVAGVLTSNNNSDQGIRMSLFRRGIASFVYDNIIDQDNN